MSQGVGATSLWSPEIGPHTDVKEAHMGVAKIAHHPDMTWEQAMEVFQKEFGDRYKVYSLKRTPMRDFAVQKNGFVGVSMRLVQTKGETKFIYSGWTPSVMARMFIGPLFGYLLWRGLTNEVKAFIARAPEFQ
jgi:hypothetical protein